MKGHGYIDELSGIVALPCLMDCSLIDFAHRIRVQIEVELKKISPDTALIALLADAARLGWEQIEWADAPLEIKERLLNCPPTQQGSEPTEICPFTGCNNPVAEGKRVCEQHLDIVF